MVRWCSFSGLGRELVAVSFASKGGQYIIYGNLQPITTQLTHNATPKIVDTQLLLIITMGQWLYVTIVPYKGYQYVSNA